MAHSSSYTVKHSGERGVLKLKLTRDPRASKVKSPPPLRQATLAEVTKPRATSTQGANIIDPTTTKSTLEAGEAIRSTVTQGTEVAKPKMSTQTQAVSGSKDMNQPIKSDQSVSPHVDSAPRPKHDKVKKSHPPAATIKLLSSKSPPVGSKHPPSKPDNTLLQSITQGYAKLETLLAKSQIQRSKPIEMKSPPSHTASRQHHQPVLVFHAPSAAKHSNPMASAILSNPVTSSNVKPINLLASTATRTPKPVPAMSSFSPPRQSKPVPSLSAKSVAAGKPSKPSVVTASVKERNPVAPSSSSLPKAKKPRVASSSLPASRVRTIMKTNVKSSQNSLNISQESVTVVGRATELFIAELVKVAHKAMLESAQNEVTYNHLARAVHNNPDEMQFLYDILPEKVRARDFLASLKAQQDDDTPAVPD